MRGRMVERRLKKYGIEHLHYMAPMDNIPLILAIGIVSYNKATKIPHQSVALWSVQKRRQSVIPGTGKQIQDYVPLYFATHTPMQYVITTPAHTKKRDRIISQQELIFIEVNAKKVFETGGVIFTDGNAAANETQCYFDLGDLKKLDWESIWLPNEYPQCYDRDWQRKKASEVLVPDHVPIDYFLKIVLFSVEAVKQLNRKVTEITQLLKAKDSDQDWKHLAKYNYSVDPTHYF